MPAWKLRYRRIHLAAPHLLPPASKAASDALPTVSGAGFCIFLQILLGRVVGSRPRALRLLQPPCLRSPSADTNSPVRSRLFSRCGNPSVEFPVPTLMSYPGASARHVSPCRLGHSRFPVWQSRMPFDKRPPPSRQSPLALSLPSSTAFFMKASRSGTRRRVATSE